MPKVQSQQTQNDFGHAGNEIKFPLLNPVQEALYQGHFEYQQEATDSK